jgi:ATP/maltotriose-dependent transcriptional regulator MalT
VGLDRAGRRGSARFWGTVIAALRACGAAHAAKSLASLTPGPRERERCLERHPRHRTSHGAFRAELLDCFADSPARRGTREAASPGTFTVRELTVLSFLPTNLTAAEIATEVSVPVHAVKMHLRNVYAKLDVHRRTDTVDRARGLGLLGPLPSGR